MSDALVEAVAEALHDRRYNDLSGCPYFMRSFGGDPKGICFKGCSSEPECITCQPSYQWTGERIRERYASLLTGEDVFGEPTDDERIDAVAVLEALHAAGWRVVKPYDDIPDSADPISDWIVEEWTPVEIAGGER